MLQTVSGIPGFLSCWRWVGVHDPARLLDAHRSNNCCMVYATQAVVRKCRSPSLLYACLVWERGWCGFMLAVGLPRRARCLLRKCASQLGCEAATTSINCSMTASGSVAKATLSGAGSLGAATIKCKQGGRLLLWSQWFRRADTNREGYMCSVVWPFRAKS